MNHDARCFALEMKIMKSSVILQLTTLRLFMLVATISTEGVGHSEWYWGHDPPRGLTRPSFQCEPIHDIFTRIILTKRFTRVIILVSYQK
jgi:hypothetical protein